MELIKGWAIDLKAIYGKLWKDKQRFTLREDLWESRDGNTGALLYAIGEVSVSAEVGRLAVLRRKTAPELTINLSRLECWYLHATAVQFGENEILFIHRFGQSGGRFTIGVTALDLGRREMAPVDGLAEDFHTVRFVEGTVYAFTPTSPSGAGERVIDLNHLEWQPAV